MKKLKELAVAKEEIGPQKEKKRNRVVESLAAKIQFGFKNKDKLKLAAELVIANRELASNNYDKVNQAAELKTANEELNQLDERLQSNLKEISDYKYALDEATIIAITDRKGIIKKVNNNFCIISKYTEQELIGQDHRIINSGYHTKLFFKDLWLTIANGKIWKGEVKNKAKDGTFYWVDTTIVPFLDDRSKPYQYLAIRADITDRKEAEAYLTQRTAQLGTANEELAFQNNEKESRAAELILANEELAFQNNEKENRAAELVIANKELAFQNEEKENRAAELVIANKELAFQNNEKENRAAELILANIELAFQNNEKGDRQAELLIANVELAYQNDEKEKRAADLVILSRDLKSQQEELKRANDLLVMQEEKVLIVNQALLQLNLELEKRVANRTKALAESEIRFRNMMETIPQIAWTNTIDGEVTFYNQRWYDYTGQDRKTTNKGGLETVIHPDDFQNALDQYRSITQASKGGEFQIRGKREDGLYLWHLIRLMPIQDEDGEVQLWVGTATDIQELKLLQQQKDDFISIASHELKTPITSLKASLQLLDKLKNNPSSTMFTTLVGVANKSLDKVSILIQDLLSASKVNDGQLHINKKQFVISSIIDECCPHVRTEGIYTIKTECDNEIKVLADESRVDQIVVNFVNNAIKYAPLSKEILIKIEKINDMAKVSVIDKGPGISAEKVPHLFDRYYRVDSSGSQYSGLGLGLYICSEIIKKHDGQIGVDSEIGKGSSFWFTIPLA
jgi:PAS domain S-box-containing protein